MLGIRLFSKYCNGAKFGLQVLYTRFYGTCGIVWQVIFLAGEVMISHQLGICLRRNGSMSGCSQPNGVMLDNGKISDHDGMGGENRRKLVSKA